MTLTSHLSKYTTLQQVLPRNCLVKIAQPRRPEYLVRIDDIEDRLALTYRYFFDLSEAEMAAALGVARGTVKSRLSRAMVRLREVYADA